ncbi:MAG: hypothetical protein ACXW5W_19205, partial [Candidatus Binatia bacterium]
VVDDQCHWRLYLFKRVRNSSVHELPVLAAARTSARTVSLWITPSNQLAFMTSHNSAIAHFLDHCTYGLAAGHIFWRTF